MYNSYNYFYNFSQYRIKEIDKILGLGTRIRYNCIILKIMILLLFFIHFTIYFLRDFPITVDESNPINEVTLIKTYKEFFCIIC